jgi:hypothetical protein
MAERRNGIRIAATGDGLACCAATSVAATRAPRNKQWTTPIRSRPSTLACADHRKEVTANDLHAPSFGQSHVAPAATSIEAEYGRTKLTASGARCIFDLFGECLTEFAGERPRIACQRDRAGTWSAR